MKGGPLGVFENPFSCKIGKNEEGTFRTNEKKMRKKVSQSREKTALKFLINVVLEPTSFCLADLKKTVTSMPSASRVTSVASSGS